MFFEFKYPFSKNIYRCWCANNTIMISTSLLERCDALENALKSRKRFLSQDQCLSLISVYFWRSKKRRSNYEGKEFIQGFFKSGESFDGPLVLVNRMYPANATATEDSLILVVKKIYSKNCFWNVLLNLFQ
jgi:hypothetical protein